MKQGEVFARLRRIVSQEIEKPEEEITPETKFVEDLNLDSIQIVEIIIALEDELGITISEEDLGEISTLGQAAKNIAALL